MEETSCTEKKEKKKKSFIFFCLFACVLLPLPLLSVPRPTVPQVALQRLSRKCTALSPRRTLTSAAVFAWQQRASFP